MKKIICLGIVITCLLSVLCGCKSYTCYDCGKNTHKAYYDASANEESVLCEDCAREWWMPFPYENYRVK